MSTSDDVVRLPPTDKHLGSCPECGKPIWESYLHHYETVIYGDWPGKPFYQCMECKGVYNVEQIIPF